ncbi:MAG TPA: alpha/beta hydrolase [Candidatus Limnocylindrales bacterium]
MAALTAIPDPTLIRLPDGRDLETWVVGPDDGETLIFIHGSPGAGMPDPADVAEAIERGLRWISWSRPGYGASTPLPDRSVAHIAADAAAVLDHLGIDRAHVVGHSGGGPHAIACAALLPPRVAGAATIGGVAPYGAAGLDWFAGMGPENVHEFGETLKGREAETAAVERMGPAWRVVTGADIIAAFGGLIDVVDAGSLTSAYGEFLAAECRHALSQSYEGWIDDDLAFAKPWGVDLAAVQPPVHIWQGAHDRMVPFGHGQWLAAHVSSACPHLFAEHGHLSLVVDSFGAILDELVAPAR